MSSASDAVHFGPFEVTEQVFLRTRHSFALVNLKPLLPGHVLVCPLQPHKRLTDLSAEEVSDLMGTVQRVQRMLARHYFSAETGSAGRDSAAAAAAAAGPPPEAGSFNIAVQDGPDAGQTVSHVHVHVIPRVPGATAKAPGPADELYERMAGEEGNVGGALWDETLRRLGRRPVPQGEMSTVDDCERKARSLEEMVGEVEAYKRVLGEMDTIGTDGLIRS